MLQDLVHMKVIVSILTSLWLPLGARNLPTLGDLKRSSVGRKIHRPFQRNRERSKISRRIIFTGNVYNSFNILYPRLEHLRVSFASLIHPQEPAPRFEASHHISSLFWYSKPEKAEKNHFWRLDALRHQKYTRGLIDLRN